MPAQSPPQPEETPMSQEETAGIATCDCGWGCELGCDSEDDAALLEMAMQDCEAELHMAGLGQGPPLVFMSSRILSYLVEYLLADKFKRLSIKKIYPKEDLEQNDIVWGDRAAFSNPWEGSSGPECRKGVLNSLGETRSCDCYYCHETNNPANLKPGSTVRVRAVQKVTVMGNEDKDIEPDILARLRAPTPLVPIKIMAECQSKE